MSFSLSKSIIPMSELRADPDKIKKRLKDSPVVITNKGTPDFGVCDLETLEIAIKVKELKNLLKMRLDRPSRSYSVDEAFDTLNKKYGL